MSKRTRSPSPVSVRTRANLVRANKIHPKDADYVDLALDLFPLFEGFGPDLLRKLVTHIVKAEFDDRVHLHVISDPRARTGPYRKSDGNVDKFFNNDFMVKRVKWWSRLFANVLSLRSSFISLEEHERQFWKHFNLAVGTLMPNAPFLLTKDIPGRHFIGDWMRFRAPVVPASLYHLDGTLHSHTYHPTSMPGFEFYAHFPKNPLSVEEAVDTWGKEIEVLVPPMGDAGGPGIPFSSITSRGIEKGTDEYKLEKRMVIWKERIDLDRETNAILPGMRRTWVVDRHIGKGLVNDFNETAEEI